MFFWKKKESNDQVQTRQRDEESLREIEAGRIPLVARERLEGLMKSPNHLFSTDLTTNEFLMAREAGFQPITQVMGCAFMNIALFGTQSFKTYTGEVTDVSRAQSEVRKLAIGRLLQEAKMLNATGVIGIRLKRKHHDERMLEFTAVGTAIKVPGAKDTDEPFTSLLSGQEFWQLHQAGYWPVGVSMGVSCHYIHTDIDTRSSLYGFFGNNNKYSGEVFAYTQGFYDAREIALNELSKDVERQNADGCIGMRIEQNFESIEYERNKETWIDLVANICMMGTTIRKVAEPAAPKRGSTLVMYDLAQKRDVDLDFDF